MKHKQQRLILLGFISLCLTVCILVSDMADAASRDIAVKNRQGQTVGSYKNSFALLVGVSDYTAGWPDLEQIPKELSLVEQVLENQGFKVVKVMDPDAREMKAAFENFIDTYGYEPTNRLLFFYSGHGHTTDDGNRGYLVPADAPDPRKNLKDFKRKALDMNQILAWCRGIDAHHDLFLFDSCFSGVIFKQKDLPETPPHITQLTAKPVRQFITAGSAGEPVPARSVFTPAFVDAIQHGLGDLDKDGYVSGTELGLYLQRVVPRYSSHQSPQYGKIGDYNLSRGDFIFKVAGGEPPPPPSPVTTGSLRVTSQPSGAGIFLNNNLMGKTPLDISSVSPGEYQVLATLDGYISQEKKVTVYGGRRAMVILSFDPVKTRARLYVTPKPSDAGVRIMNIPDKYYSGMELDPGRYDVEVSQAGYITKRQWVEIKGGDGIDLYVELEKEPDPDPRPGTGRQEWKDPVTGMPFVWVPKGCFMMGSNDGDADEKPVHKVCLDGFWMGKYEVTQGQWQKIMGSNPSSFKSGQNYPVESVSWDDAKKFITKLNQQSGNRFALPTEAQWEYACRAGTTTKRYWGDNISCDKAMYENDPGSSEDSCVNFVKKKGLTPDSTAPVGSYDPNPYGLYDMLGNVSEWCEDIYGSDAYKKHSLNNPIYAQGGSDRVYRGGSWSCNPAPVRCAFRFWNTPVNRSNYLGFRLLRTD